MASGSSDAGNVSPSPASILLDKEAHIAFSRNHTTARAKRLGSEHTHHSPPLAQLISTCSPPPPPRAPPGGRNWLLVLAWPRIAARSVTCVMDMHTIGECCSSRLKKLSSLLQLPSEIQPSRMSESERRADGPAAGGLGRTPESKGPTTPASALVPAGGMGEDAAQELLDWGSIEDEDGAFGQLSTAGKLQVQDSATSEALLPGGGHASAGGKLANGAGDAGAINPPAQPCAADVNTMSLGGMLLASGGIQGELAAAAAGCAAQGILQNGDLGLHGAPESSTGQAYAAERTNASQAEAAVDPLVDVEPPRLGALQGSVPDLSGSRGSAGPLPEGTPPNTSVQGSDQRAQPGIAERATIDNDGTEATCDAGRAINASGATAGATAAETAAKAGTRGHDTGKYAYLNPVMYRETNDTYEVDQEFVKFYEKLEMETKGIVTDLEDRKLQWKGFEAWTFLRALKIAVGFRKIYRKLFFSSVQMDFYRALRQIHEQNICPLFSVLMEPELKYKENPKNHSPKPGSIKNTYDTFLAEIPADATEHLAQQLIKDAVKKIVLKQKTYYDYIKKKLEVAEKIQLIPCEILMSRERKVVEGIQHKLYLELVTRRGPVPRRCAVPWRHRTNEAGQEEEIG